MSEVPLVCSTVDATAKTKKPSLLNCATLSRKLSRSTRKMGDRSLRRLQAVTLRTKCRTSHNLGLQPTAAGGIVRKPRLKPHVRSRISLASPVDYP